MSERWIRWFVVVFLPALVVWTVTGLILALPHGYGRSIESMGGVQTVHDFAAVLWEAAFVGILAAVALAGLRALSKEREPGQL